jgi:hypothetical protein
MGLLLLEIVDGIPNQNLNNFKLLFKLITRTQSDVSFSDKAGISDDLLDFQESCTKICAEERPSAKELLQARVFLICNILAQFFTESVFPGGIRHRQGKNAPEIADYGKWVL